MTHRLLGLLGFRGLRGLWDWLLGFPCSQWKPVLGDRWMIQLSLAGTLTTSLPASFLGKKK